MTSTAEAARSILARPGDRALEVSDGVRIDVRCVELGDAGGVPRLSCPVGAGLATYAERRAPAVLRVDTPRGERDTDGRPVDQTLTLSGTLRLLGVEEQCDCCDQARHVVHLEPEFVLLTTWVCVGGRRFAVGRPERIDVADFCSTELVLNAGYLRAAAEHATDCHQDELRRALASRTRTSEHELIAVQLTDLTPRSVDLVWVDSEGAHRTVLTFPRRVRDPRELAAALRARLGVRAC